MKRVALPLALVLAVGCGQSPNHVTVHVVAAQGGTLALDDGTQLQIPAGALPQDTDVTLTRIDTPAPGPNGVLGTVQLDPDGLVLNAPAHLTMKYDPSRVAADDELDMVVMSALNPMMQQADEVSPFQLVDSATIAGGTAAADLAHFSWYSIFSYPALFAAPGIPGQYLQSGDILYSLTEAVGFQEGTGLPMHVGLYMENPTNDRVIESTLPDSDCTPNYLEGVEVHTYEGNQGFKNLCGAHIFLGARRPIGPPTESQGAAAIARANQDLGKPYGIIGLNNLNNGGGIIVGGISCVELVERAWDAAGLTISHTPNIALFPQDQYANTVPVNRITFNLGDGTLRIPIYVSVHGSKRTVYSAALPTNALAQIDVTSSTPVFTATPQRAHLEDSLTPGALKDLVFTPTRDADSGNIVPFDLAVTAGGTTTTFKDFLRVFVVDNGADGGVDAGTGGCVPGGLPCDYCMRMASWNVDFQFPSAHTVSSSGYAMFHVWWDASGALKTLDATFPLSSTNAGVEVSCVNNNNGLSSGTVNATAQSTDCMTSGVGTPGFYDPTTSMTYYGIQSGSLSVSFLNNGADVMGSLTANTPNVASANISFSGHIYDTNAIPAQTCP